MEFCPHAYSLSLTLSVQLRIVLLPTSNPSKWASGLCGTEKDNRNGNRNRKTLHQLLYIIAMLFCFFFFFVCFCFLNVERFLQSTMWPHPSATKPIERAAGHIK